MSSESDHPEFRVITRDRRSLLANRHVCLADIEPEHYRRLFQIVRSDSVADNWQTSTQTIGYERFCQTLWDNVLVQFAFATGEAKSPPLGLVKCELANFRHQTAQVALFSSPETHSTPLPMMAMLTLINFVLSTYPLRKLYAEVPEYNYARFHSGNGTIFEVEGRLTEHELHFGETWDTFIISVDRRHWSTAIRPLVDSWRS